MVETWDVIIVGAGTAGLTALREVRKRTERVALIGEEPWGTTCARVGCMPSKLLIEVANSFHRRKTLAELGIVGAERLTVDSAAVLLRVRKMRDEFVAGTLALTRDMGERAIVGRARLLDANHVSVSGRELRAHKIILATGSRPVVPEPFQKLNGRVWTTDTLFEADTLPSRLAVVGMGAVGVELAQALARLEVDVVAFDGKSLLGGLSDPEVSSVACKLLERELPVHLGASAEIGSERDGVRVRAGDTSVVVEGVLVSLGRRPQVEGLGLSALGVPLDEQGLPPVDPQTLQVANLPVFLTGDARGAGPLHEAVDDGFIAGCNAVAEAPLRFARRTPLRITFCDPNLAVIGKRYTELDHAQIMIGEARFEHQGRARIAQKNAGIVRVYADKYYGLLLGAELCAPDGEHFAHLLALALGRRLTVHDLLRMPFYHPVLEEGLRKALRDLSSQLPPSHETDLAGCDAPQAEALG